MKEFTKTIGAVLGYGLALFVLPWYCIALMWINGGKAEAFFVLASGVIIFPIYPIIHLINQGSLPAIYTFLLGVSILGFIINVASKED